LARESQETEIRRDKKVETTMTRRDYILQTRTDYPTDVAVQLTAGNLDAWLDEPLQSSDRERINEADYGERRTQ
jgi:hypothetical protein